MGTIEKVIFYIGWLALLTGTILGILIPTNPATGWIYCAGAVLCIWHDIRTLQLRQFLMGVVALCCASYLLFEQPMNYSWALFTLIYVIVAFYYTFRNPQK